MILQFYFNECADFGAVCVVHGTAYAESKLNYNLYLVYARAILVYVIFVLSVKQSAIFEVVLAQVCRFAGMYFFVRVNI